MECTNVVLNHRYVIVYPSVCLLEDLLIVITLFGIEAATMAAVHSVELLGVQLHALLHSSPIVTWN